MYTRYLTEKEIYVKKSSCSVYYIENKNNKFKKECRNSALLRFKVFTILNNEINMEQ